MDENQNTNLDDQHAHKHPHVEDKMAQVRKRTHARIAHWCSFAALVIIVIDFAAFVIGRADPFFAEAGIMISVALLAISALKNPTNSRSNSASKK